VDVQYDFARALICGVTSSAMPEKNGVSVTLLLVVAPTPAVWYWCRWKHR